MEPILNIENLTKTYGTIQNQTKALDGITFQVMQGEFLGIMGSSGSGKSTLLNCIATVIKPSGGSILVEGKKLQSLKGTALAEYRGKPLVICSRILNYWIILPEKRIFYCRRPFMVWVKRKVSIV